MSRQTRCVVAWDVVEERPYDTMQPLLDQALERLPQARHFYSDGLDTYRNLVYRQGRRRAYQEVAPGKSQTYTVEGTNADLRCYVPPLDRRGRCFPRCHKKLQALLRLFLFCYNRCCLFRYKHTNRSAFPTIFYLCSFRHSLEGVQLARRLQPRFG